MSLDSIVNIQISRQTAGVTQAGFGVPLLLSSDVAFENEVRTYETITGVGEDVSNTTLTYKLAQKILGQTPRPRQLKIFKTGTKVAQVVTITPVAVNDHEYVVTIDGEDYTYTADTDAAASEIVAGLLALINADSNAKVTASGTTTLILTADTAGIPFTYSLNDDANMTAVLTTANYGLVDDLLKAIDLDNDFYFIVTQENGKAHVINLAQTVETLKKIYLVRCEEAAVITNATTDLASELKALTLFRSGVAFNKDDELCLEAGMIGRCAPLDPGSETWAFKTIAGVSTDKFTESQETYLKNKNCNYYVTIAGVNVTQGGKVAGGEYIDIIRFIDWIQARMQEAIFSDMAKLDKLPFTDAGIAVIENDMRSVLKNGVRVGGIASEQDFTVTVPKAKDISQADKAARRLTGMKFTAVLAGAIHAVEIQGTVTL
jgi:hypothetical protein